MELAYVPFRIAIILSIIFIALGVSPGLFAAEDPPTVLFIDDSVSIFNPSTAPYVMESLDALELEYETFSLFEAATLPTVELMLSFDVVIYSIGGNSFTSFYGDAADRMMEYLNAGGALLLSAGEYAYQTNDSFLLDYTHVAYDYYTRALLTIGASHDPIGDGMSFSTESPLGNRDYFMLVRPLDDFAQPFVTMSSGPFVNAAAVRLPADGTTLPYRMVFLSFVIESLIGLDGDRAARDEILMRMIRWLRDAESPSAVRASPSPYGSTSVSNPTISIELADKGTGVDPESVSLIVGGDEVEFWTEELGSSLVVQYAFESPLQPGSEIAVELSCSDRFSTPNQMSPLAYTFKVAEDASPDVEPPYVSDYGPSGAIDIPEDPFSVFAVIEDDAAGIDATSLMMTVNGQPVEARVEQDETGCFLTYAGIGEFGFNRDYEIEIAGADLASPPNQMEPFAFSFSIGEDIWPPFVVDCYPPDGAVVSLNDLFAQTSSGISILIRDFCGRIDPDSLRMTINGEVVNPAAPAPFMIHWGAKVNYTDDSGILDYGQEVQVTISASDESMPPNTMESFSWTFRIAEDDVPPVVVATIPVDGARNVPRNTHVFIRVSEDVSSDSVTPDMLIVESNPGGIWPGQLTFDSDASCIIFSPYDSFPSGATISAMLSDSLADETGNSMDEPYLFQYRTSGEFDFDAPDTIAFRGSRIGTGTLRFSWDPSSEPDHAFFK
ncbi:MAG: Ig-like domain-containing protein, partial [Candidatus Coatesbacteria bacterium]|nr:Ig-like domain-containing protein [Candidatus Coatesbacteria bacterium]